MMNSWFEYPFEDIKRGCAFDPVNRRHICLVCGRVFEQGEVFEVKGRFYEAGRAVELHVREEHGGMAAVLLSCDKKQTGLTDNQKELFSLMLQGQSDNEVAAKTGVTAATVRHTRFTLRERAKQAKLYIALFELVNDASKNRSGALIEIHEGARMVDERYAVTREEEEKILKSCFESLEPLRLRVFSAREKKKIVILRRLAALFEPGREYTEKQVSELLKAVYDDYATLRRYLIEYGFMERNADGSVYRLKSKDEKD